MTRLTYKIIDYPIKDEFIAASGGKEFHSSFVLSLDFKGRLRGYGESAAIPHSKEEREEMIALIEKHRRVIESYNMNEPARFWHFLNYLLMKREYLISAFDMAGWDLWSKLRAKGAAEVMEAPIEQPLPLSALTIKSNQPEDIKQLLAAYSDWPVFKLDFRNEDKIEEAVMALREAAPNAKIRIEAHESWSLDKVKSLLDLFDKCAIEMLIQPLKRDDKEGMLELRKICNIPIMANEAVRNEKEILTNLGRYDGATINLSACGGLTVGLRMIKLLKKANKKILLSDSGEGNIGSAALGQLLYFADYAEINNPVKYSKNIGKGLFVDKGVITLPEGPGWGLTF